MKEKQVNVVPISEHSALLNDALYNINDMILLRLFAEFVPDDNANAILFDVYPIIEHKGIRYVYINHDNTICAKYMVTDSFSIKREFNRVVSSITINESNELCIDDRICVSIINEKESVNVHYQCYECMDNEQINMAIAPLEVLQNMEIKYEWYNIIDGTPIYRIIELDTYINEYTNQINECIDTLYSLDKVHGLKCDNIHFDNGVVHYRFFGYISNYFCVKASIYKYPTKSILIADVYAMYKYRLARETITTFACIPVIRDEEDYTWEFKYNSFTEALATLVQIVRGAEVTNCSHGGGYAFEARWNHTGGSCLDKSNSIIYTVYTDREIASVNFFEDDVIISKAEVSLNKVKTAMRLPSSESEKIKIGDIFTNDGTIELYYQTSVFLSDFCGYGIILDQMFI